jgi:hypothetical protein
MSDQDDRLVEFLRQDLPPAIDPHFRIAVLARLERRRVRTQLATLGAVGIAALSAFLSIGPSLFQPSWAAVLSPLSIMVALGALGVRFTGEWRAV